MVVGNGAPPLLTGDNGDARVLHECLQIGAGLGPEHTTAGQYCRSPGPAQDLRCLVDGVPAPSAAVAPPSPGPAPGAEVFGTAKECTRSMGTSR